MNLQYTQAAVRVFLTYFLSDYVEMLQKELSQEQQCH